VLVECSPAIVAQINLVNNFTGNGVVKSFYVPYFCPECDEEKVLLVEAADMGPAPHEPPTCRCDECDLVMDFDDMPDSYFAFLSNQKKLADRESMTGLPNGEGGAKSKVRSRISSPSIPPNNNNVGPSVPSLPSIQRTTSSPPVGGAPNMAAGMGPQMQSGPIGGKSPSRPPSLGVATQQSGSNPQLRGSTTRPPGQQGSGSRPPGFAGMQNGQPNMHMSGVQPGASFGFSANAGAAPPRSNGLVFLLIAILVAAIGVLAYLVLSK
jgi:hypothetical protein